MPEFKVVADFEPTGDQPQAIAKLVEGIRAGYKAQTLLGVTGSGKSLDADEPVFILRGGTDGPSRPELTPIGLFVDRLLETRPDLGRAATDSVVLYLPPGECQTLSLNPRTGVSELKPVTAVSRHQAPALMFQVRTACGRSALVTGDHSLWVLREGQLVLLPTSEVHPGDYLPVPADLPAASAELGYVNLVALLDGEKLFIQADEALRRRAASTSVASVASALAPRYGYAGSYVKWHYISRSLPGSGFPLSAFGQIAVRLGLNPAPARLSEPGYLEDAMVQSRGRSKLPAVLPVTEEFLRFLGYYLAEGNGQRGYVTLASRSPAVRSDIDRILGSLGVHYVIRPSSDIQLNSTVWTILLRRLVGSRAQEKHLPPFWPQLSQRQLGLLLRAYFEGDGWVEPGSVCACTASERLASELAYALLRFGIWARLRRVWKKATNGGHTGAWYWIVSISSQRNLRRFADGIGFVSDEKGQALRRILDRKPDTNVDVLPGCGGVIRTVREAAGLGLVELAHRCGLSHSALSLIESGHRRPRRDTVQRLVEEAERALGERAASSESLRALKALANGTWTPVVSVEAIPYNRPYVYDLTVADNETFVAGFGGLFVHNTYTMAKVVEQVQKPTLVIAHNKTLAAQLASEFKEFFPNNAVEYFVSYYDYYQPEAYIPRTDTYIEKDSSINDEIDRLRHSATQALFTRRDVLIVASVSCIYSLGEPEEYNQTVVHLKKGETRKRDKVLRFLTDIHYERNDVNFTRGKFRVRGDTLEIHPAYDETAVRVEFWGDEIERIVEVDPLTGEILLERAEVDIYPAKHFVTNKEKLAEALADIEAELEERVKELTDQGKLLEAQRLRQRTEYDLEMLREAGFCSGIENYSRHLSRRAPGSQPWTLLDYFPDDFLMFVDESHMTLPQIRGMYHGDRSRKEVLVDYGFRLPSALDNRPLTFAEFERHVNQVVFVSATPGPYEHEHSQQIVEQVIRPTGLVDPSIEVKPTEGQIDDLVEEIKRRVARGERALVTTLTKKMAEDLADYLREVGIKVHYLHSDVETLERVEILRDLRLGVYDVVVGINLLREGLDLPEVSLVAILDADKEGFLRSEWSLIQTMGRAARHVEGHAILYADTMTDSMKRAIDETYRRRKIQLAHNEAHGIVPAGIKKAVRELTDRVRAVAEEKAPYAAKTPPNSIPKDELARIIRDLEAQMKAAAKNLEFERAAMLRDQIVELRKELA